MDFWAPGMSPASPDKTMSITKDLIAHASLTTIATSPMFIDQELALEYVRELL